MTAGERVELPIFELPAVLLPGELTALHIFEERYKRMIAHCLETDAPFGMVYRDDDGARRIGCEARVSEVVERFDDGRLNIVVSGERPFRVLERFDGDDYPAGEVAPIEIAADRAAEGPAEAASGDLAREAFAALVGRVSGEEPDVEQVAGDDSYAIAARVELPVETKQRLLELRSEPARMRILAGALRALVQTLERSREIAERARLNGKVVLG